MFSKQKEKKYCFHSNLETLHEVININVYIILFIL